MERLKLALILILLSTPCFAATQTIDTTAVNLDGGTIDGTKIGSSSAADATFNTVEFNNGTNYDDRIITVMPATDGSSSEVEINRAIAILKAKSTSNAVGGTVRLGRGTFFLNNPIVIDAPGIRLEGTGGVRSTRLHLNSSANCNIINITTAGTRSIRIKDLELYGTNSTNTTGHGIYWSASDSSVDADSFFENVIIFFPAQSGFYMDAASARGLHFNNVRVLFPKEYGIRLTSSDHSLTNTNVVDAHWSGFMIDAWNVRFHNCRADINNNNWDTSGTLYSGVKATDVKGYGYYLNGNNILMNGCDTQANYTHGVYVGEATDVAIVGNRFEADAVDFGSGKTVAGNWSGIYVSEDAKDVNITGNNFSGLNLFADNRVAYAVTVDGADTVNINSNIIDNMHQDGIRVINGAQNVSIMANQVKNTQNSGDGIDIQAYGALNFDGSGDYVTISNDSSNNATFGTTTGMSYTGWIYVRTDGEADTGRIFDKRGAGGASGAWLTTQSQSGSNFSLWFQIDRATQDASCVVILVPLNQWHHFAVTWGGGDGTGSNAPKIYIDGALATTTSTPTGGSGTIVDDTANSLILGNSPNNNRALDGYIRGFKVYRNQNLSAQDVLTDMRGGLPYAPNANYAFTEGTGSTLTDSGSGADNGTITNAAWSDGGTAMKNITIFMNQIFDTQDTETQAYGINVKGASPEGNNMAEAFNIFYGNVSGQKNNFPVTTTITTSSTISATGGVS